MQEASKEAVAYAIEAFRVVIGNRRDLINMSGPERSMAILME